MKSKGRDQDVSPVPSPQESALHSNMAPKNQQLSQYDTIDFGLDAGSKIEHNQKRERPKNERKEPFSSTFSHSAPIGPSHLYPNEMVSFPFLPSSHSHATGSSSTSNISTSLTSIPDASLTPPHREFSYSALSLEKSDQKGGRSWRKGEDEEGHIMLDEMTIPPRTISPQQQEYLDAYRAEHSFSLNHPEAYWMKQAKRVQWKVPPTKAWGDHPTLKLPDGTPYRVRTYVCMCRYMYLLTHFIFRNVFATFFSILSREICLGALHLLVFTHIAYYPSSFILHSFFILLLSFSLLRSSSPFRDGFQMVC